jgi:uncharacterized protein YdbL (DUF1318 family)
MTDAGIKAIVDTLAAQRNQALDTVADQNGYIAELTAKIAELTAPPADTRATPPVPEKSGQESP